MEVCADTEFGDEAIQLAQEHAPNVVLLDMKLKYSKVSGLNVLRSVLPPAEHAHRRIVRLRYDDLVFPALQCGAIGYLLKRAYPHEVIEAVRDASTGHYHLDPFIAHKIVTRLLDQNGQGTEPSELKRLDTART